MKRHKAPGVSGLVADMIQTTGDIGIQIVGVSACVIFILLQKIQKMAKCIFWYRLTRVAPDKVHRAVKWLCCVCNGFEVKVSMHQGSALSPLLFVMVIEALSREFRVALPWELLYADALVVIAETATLNTTTFLVYPLLTTSTLY